MTRNNPVSAFTLRSGRVITPDEVLSPGWVVIEAGKIANAGAGAPPPAGPEVDVGDWTLVPGFVDLHVHGGGGHSLTTTDVREVEGYARWAPSTGVTSFLATIVSRDVEEGVRQLRAVAGSRPGGGAAVVGINLEGPFLNPERCGAIPRSWITMPDAAVFDRLWEASGGLLRLMTLAPEMPGADGVIAAARARNVAISLGHTDATYDVSRDAFGAGASHVTHAFNAMRPFHHREPGPIGAAFDSDGVMVEVIADGVHLHPATVRWLVKALGPERIALVTDGTPMSGGSDGSFKIGGARAMVSAGRATLSDGTIAGSVATMDGIVRNVIEWGVCGLQDAVRMASTTPAGVAGAGRHKGRIEPGYDADIVALDRGGRVREALIGGESVWNVKNG